MRHYFKNGPLGTPAFRHHLSETLPPADNAIQPTRPLNVNQSNYGSLNDRKYADDNGTDER